MARTGIEMSFNFAKPKRRVQKDPDLPLRVLVLGDFSGRRRQTSDTTRKVKLRRIDLADVDATLRTLSPALELDAGDGRSVLLRFEQMDDFHPNHLFETLDIFGPLKALKRDLDNPTTASETLARIRARTGANPGSAPSASPAESGASREPQESDRDSLARLLGKPSAAPAQQAAPPTNAARIVDALLRPVVTPQPAAAPAAELAEVRRTLGDASSALMRSVLHHPEFRALEAAWRGLGWLCSQLGEAPNVELFVLDISKQELAADWRDASDPTESALHALVAGGGGPDSGEVPWSMIVGDYDFEMSSDDCELLSRMATLGEEAGAAFLSGANWAAFADQREASGASPQWDSLRSRPESSYVGLAAPGFLLRLPYGKKSDPIDAFEFEELAEPSDYSQCLWGNAAWLCAGLIGMAFMQSGWTFSPGDELEVSGLPVHVYREDGETVQAPCAETWISAAHAERWSGKGLMVLQPVRGRDSVRLLRFQSLHQPPTALSGPWS